MAQAQTNKEYRTFVKGLITEATALTFPENASLDEANFVLNRDGSRQRRLGMDYEVGYLPTTITAVDVGTLADAAISLFKWTNAGDGTYNFWVLQVGKKLFFGNAASTAISSGYLSALTIDLSTYSTHADYYKYPVSMASGKGHLFVTGKYINPFNVHYNSGAGTTTKESMTLKIRDLVGVNDGTLVGLDQTTLTAAHKYNLKNQGWRSADAVLGEYYDDIAYWLAAWPGTYPANNKIPASALTANYEPDPVKLRRIPFGEVNAPRGRFVLDLFNRDRATVSNIAGCATTETESGRPEALAFYAGRVWYAGVQSNPSDGEFNIAGHIFFSQLLETAHKANLCYQEADPTSYEISDLVATDGGAIRIPEIGKVHRMVNIRNSLVIFADNGVWDISGSGADEGFSATGYQVKKISSVGSLSPQSIVEVEGYIFYPSFSGIYVLAPNQVTGLLEAINITETTIQKAYLAVPTISKVYSVGNYDSINKKVSWLYNDDATYDGVSYKYWYKKELIFDTVLKAFYRYEIVPANATQGPWVSGYIPSSATSVEYTVNTIVAGGSGNPVVATNPTQVIAGSTAQPGRGSTLLKYITFVMNNGTTSVDITFSHYKATSFKDWDTYAGGVGLGANYDSFLITGYELLEDTMRNKQVVYLVPHFARTETGYNSDMTYKTPSGCYIRTMWDFCSYGNTDPFDGSLSGKWGTPFQAYRLLKPYIPSGPSDGFKYGYDIVSTKNRVRGGGKAFSMRIYSEAGKDMHLLGWGVKFEGATIV